MEREKVERILKEMEGSEPWFYFIVKKIAQMTFLSRNTGQPLYNEKLVSRVRKLNTDGLRVFIQQVDTILPDLHKGGEA